MRYEEVADCRKNLGKTYLYQQIESLLHSGAAGFQFILKNALQTSLPSQRTHMSFANTP